MDKLEERILQEKHDNQLYLDFDYCNKRTRRHFQPEEYKQIFQDFCTKHREEYNYLNNMIHEYLTKKDELTLDELRDNINFLETNDKTKDAYHNIVDRLEETYGTKRGH